MSMSECLLRSTIITTDPTNSSCWVSIVHFRQCVVFVLDALLCWCLNAHVIAFCVQTYFVSWILLWILWIMGNEGSIPSDTESQVSDWQSIYSLGSRAGRRSSLGSMRIPSPMEPPEPDLSHLSPEEVAKIREVIGRAKEMKDEENKRIRWVQIRKIDSQFYNCSLNAHSTLYYTPIVYTRSTFVTNLLPNQPTMASLRR